jgi:hypothetical protein
MKDERLNIESFEDISSFTSWQAPITPKPNFDKQGIKQIIYKN